MFDVGELAARALVGGVEEHASYHVVVRLGQVKVVSGKTHARGSGGGGGRRGESRRFGEWDSGVEGGGVHSCHTIAVVVCS